MNSNIKWRRLTALALPGLCWMLAASTTACGDDDDSSGSAAGSGGSSNAGSAGKNTGGSATAGTGGKNTGGTSNGGTSTAGSNAAGGDAGEGPTAQGGAGGEPEGVTGGAGGEGGSAEACVPTSGPELALTLDVKQATTDGVGYLTVSADGHERFYGTTFDAAGNIYAVGQVTTSNAATADIATIIAKFKPTGELDATFGAGGVFIRNVAKGTNGELFRNIVVQSTGKLVAVGGIEDVCASDARDRDLALIRVNANGTKDTTFGDDGVVRLPLSQGVVSGSTLLVDSAWGLDKYPGNDDRLAVSGGKVRTGGADTDFVVMRLSADGVPDESFGAHGLYSLDTKVTGNDHNNASPRNVTILPGTDGIIGAGYQPSPGHDTSPVLYKLTDAGVLDDDFGDHGVFHTSLLTEQTETYQAVVQPIAAGGYKLVTTGYGKEAAGGTTDLVSLRLTSDGKIDESWGDHGIAQLDIGGFGDNSRKLLVLPDRRVVLVGGGRLTESDVDGVVAVLTEDGKPDTTFAVKGFKTFNLGGPADFFWGVALSPDKTKLAIGGIRGVGAAPVPATAADDAALLLLPTP